MLVCLLLGAALAGNAAEILRLDGTTLSTTEAEAFARKTLEAERVTGAQIAVVEKGRLVWSAGFGLRRRNPDLPMTPETNIWAASITKSVFATYVMQLVERGEFSLDTPVAQLLPKPLDSYEPYRETASALVQDPRWPKLTPRILLAHTSGLLNFAFLEPDKKMHLHFEPGSRYGYSGEGINLVQFVIEQRKGRKLEELMQEAIFGPLGMTRTGIIYRKEFEANVADRFGADGEFLSQTRRFPARGAGSMASTSEDLARFCSALFAGKITRPKTRKQMLAPVIPIRTLRQFPGGPDDPEAHEARNVGLAYGIGWGLLTRTRFGPAFFKEGHGDGAQNYLICFEKRQMCMILLTNSDNGEFAFRPLLEKIIGNTVTPWEWEGYTRDYIERVRRQK